MSDFENYPYNEQHELNLDPTLKAIKEDKTTAENANKRVDGVEDTINNDNKKLDDANAKADAINQNADNFVDQSNTRINDIENNADNSIDQINTRINDIENNADNSVNDINKKADDISDKADDLNKKIDDNADKVDDINNKQNETKEQVDNSVSNAYYENELTPEEMKSAKKLGVLKVEKASGITSNEINTVTPSGGGVLGNCVVWSSTPFTFINNNPQILTGQKINGYRIIQYQCSGSFYVFTTFNKTKVGIFGSNGHAFGRTTFIDNYLITPKHLNFYADPINEDDECTVILPKTDSKTWDGGYEQFLNIKANSILTTKQNLLSNHVYVYYMVTVSTYITVTVSKVSGYIYNGELIETIVNVDEATVELNTNYYNNTVEFKIGSIKDGPGSDRIEARLYFIDLGEM